MCIRDSDTIFNSIMFYLDNIDFKNIDQENNSNKLLNKVINFVIHNSINKNIIIMKCIKKYSDTYLINTQQQIDFIQELLTEIDSHKYITISLCIIFFNRYNSCLLYTSDAADDMQCVDLGGRRIIKK